MDSEQSMATASSSSLPSSERTSHYIAQTEMEMKTAKCHWSEVDYSTAASESLAETNYRYLALLKENPLYGGFFTDFPALEVGEKISEGAQADIYEARNKRDGPYDLVAKVMKGDVPLKAFQTQWPIGLLSARCSYKLLFDLPLITILGGTVLHDKRLRGRFAFVMYRRWGDLRFLIDRRMKQERSTPGPFPIDEAIHLMLSIAEHMVALHDNHGIIHRDLKASNVLVWGNFGEDISLVAPPNRVERIESVVADFECSVGVMGTRFWMAPEIREQLKSGLRGQKVRFRRASDVYSYGMTCYEIVTGCLPYDGLGGEATTLQFLQGQCPEFPHELPEFVRSIIVRCWHSDPLLRPTFSDICMALKLKRGANPLTVVIDNKSETGASIVKVEQWNNPQPLTLFEVMQKLMAMDLLVLKAFYLSSTEMIKQYFEVVDCEGKKVMNDKSIAEITQVLSFPVKMKWINESPGTSVDGNIIVQMYVVEVISERRAGLLFLYKLLVAKSFQVHSTSCWTREDRVECVMYVEGAGMGTLLWALRHDTENFSLSTGRFRIIVHRVAAEELSPLNGRLRNLESMDLTPRCSSSDIRVRRGKESDRFTEVVVRVDDSCPLIRWIGRISRTFERMDYKIVGADFRHLGGSLMDHLLFAFPQRRVDNRKVRDLRFFGEDISVGTPGAAISGKIHRIRDVAIERGCREKDRVNRSEDIDLGTLGEHESVKICKTLEFGTERGYPEGKSQFIIHGPDKELDDNLMRSLGEIGFIVTGGQVYRDGGEFGTGHSFPPGYLEFFVIEKPAAGDK